MTLNQLNFTKREKKKNKTRTKGLKNAPHRKGVCEKVYIMTPKKPNSAKRKITKVRLLFSDQKILCYIPGEGHQLQQYNHVLVRGGKVRDLPGIRYTLVRGKYDLQGILRRNARSRYGCKNWIFDEKKEEDESVDVKSKK
jgi:small subunit ribosomal protein S12